MNVVGVVFFFWKCHSFEPCVSKHVCALLDFRHRILLPFLVTFWILYFLFFENQKNAWVDRRKWFCERNKLICLGDNTKNIQIYCTMSLNFMQFDYNSHIWSWMFILSVSPEQWKHEKLNSSYVRENFVFRFRCQISLEHLYFSNTMCSRFGKK